MIEKAIQLALTSNEKYRVACLLLDRKGRLISKATNSSSKSHPVQAKWAERVGKPENVFLHAEVAALIKAKKKPHTAVVVRLKADGSMGLAKPCPICEAALSFAQVKVVYFSTDSQTIKRIEL